MSRTSRWIRAITLSQRIASIAMATAGVLSETTDYLLFAIFLWIVADTTETNEQRTQRMERERYEGWEVP